MGKVALVVSGSDFFTTDVIYVSHSMSVFSPVILTTSLVVTVRSPPLALTTTWAMVGFIASSYFASTTGSFGAIAASEFESDFLAV